MNKLDFTKFDAIIFDMDGVLVDSEPLWKIAMEEVFCSLGSTLTKTDFQQTVGMRIDHVIDFWKRIENWPESTQLIENQIINKMVSLIKEKGFPLPGVVETIQHLQKTKKIGLASSSPKVLIHTVLEKLNIQSNFHGIFSAEEEKHGKPHPAVYIKAAEKLECEPHRCLVIEDSLTGVISGKAANMTVICIPEKSHLKNPKLILADFHFDTMSDFYDSLG
jgi:sugar-phosphatase